jgi:hypothetical protein
MFKIVIIGAGQLGSRHLQGVLRSNITASIEVVDPNAQSIKNAILRSNEINFDKNKLKATFYQNLNEISEFIDLCIIASTADKRFGIIKAVLTISKVQNMILEKVLFQNLSEYNVIDKLLNINGVRTWINCPRRIIKEYQDIKSQIDQEEIISMKVIGTNWGLACNSIHFLDLFNYFTESSLFSFNSSGLNKIIPAKREGFYELLGTLTIKDKMGSNLFIQSNDSEINNFDISITTKNKLYNIKESIGEVEIFNIQENKKEKKYFQMPYQSQITGIIIEEILLKGSSGLTPYSVSSLLHIQLLTSFSDIFKQIHGNEINHCPIT